MPRNISLTRLRLATSFSKPIPKVPFCASNITQQYSNFSTLFSSKISQTVSQSSASQLNSSAGMYKSFYSTDSAQEADPTLEPRISEDVDVLIVGAGPAGLAAAIRLKQNAIRDSKEVRVVVVEKGPEIGAHNLAGAVLEPNSLEMLFPDWKAQGAPLLQPALKDEMKFLTKKHAIPIPHPPQMSNHGNYIISLSNLVKWLGTKAEELEIEVFPGFAASEVIYNDKGQVTGVATNDFGLDKNFKPKASYERGLEFNSKVTLFAEGCHGSLSKEVINKFSLRPPGTFQTYGIGLKELWEIDPSKHEPGKVVHTLGYPLDAYTYGGSFIYHMQDNLLSIGLVVGLDYTNPYLSPYQEFQKLKTHPYLRNLLEGGRVLSYGARTLVEGGIQSLPKLAFPGGALLGDSAGLVNVPKIKGIHNAIHSGILAADSVSKALESESDSPLYVEDYQESFNNSQIYKELYEVRNIRPSFHSPLGMWGGVLYSGIDTMLLKGKVPFTFQHGTPDHLATKYASECKPINYPKADNKVSFDILTSVSRTGTNHAENQPVHLRVTDIEQNPERNLHYFAGLEQKFCPAGVYEYVDNEAQPGTKRLQVNSQNCIHCKTCDIKDPHQKINWTVPEGGGGPQYVDT
ncbi:hypothetical protein BB561_003859 [Smittium simulii]|uniref:Electron transfer flavoprotein-ubiquinone oxidoreductase n=1 Tax=Smittium simulii TaxID=133385 RepID=A0A2T9YJC8_9FUNG|nr:hypothetical protein BB561_003859 [Smittium simulii]